MSNFTVASPWAAHQRQRTSYPQRLWPWVAFVGTAGLGPLILVPGRLVDRAWQPVFVLLLALLGAGHAIYHYRDGRTSAQNYHRRNRRDQVRRLGFGPLYLLTLWAFPVIAIAIDGTSAWEAAGYLLFGVLLYQSIYHLPWFQMNPSRLLWLFGIVAVGLLVMGPPLVQWKQEFRLFYLPIYDWFQAIAIDMGESVHANILAGALVPLVALGTALALPPIQQSIEQVEADSGRHKYIRVKPRRRDRLQRTVAGLLAFGLFTLLLLTQSRGAYLGVSVALFVLGLIRWHRLRLLLPFLLIGSAFVIYQLGSWRFFDLLGADNTFGGAEWRTTIWQIALQAVHDFAYTGIGIGNFRAVLPLLYPHPALSAESANHAHNLWLQLAVDLGLPGLIVYLYFVGNTMWVGFSHLRQRTADLPTLPTTVDQGRATGNQQQKNSRDRRRQLVHKARQHNDHWALVAGAVAALIGIQVHGLLDAVTWGTKLAFLPWLCLVAIALVVHEPPTEASQIRDQTK